MLYIPSFCIVEVLNTFARRYFRDSELGKTEYEDCLSRFRDDIHWGKTLYSYDLNRYHIVGADEIIPIEHGFRSDYERGHLSAFDILVITMACELAYLGGPQNTFLVTDDVQMKTVVDRYRNTDLGRRSGAKVPGPLDDRSLRRWPAPNLIYLRDSKPGDVKEVTGQDPLNV